MQRTLEAVEHFLSAREMCELSWTCANVRDAISRDWMTQVRARFPYKKSTGDEDGGFSTGGFDARRFLLMLEERARTARASIHFTVNLGHNGCVRVIYYSDRDSLYIAHDALILRGDIIITQSSYGLYCRAYIFDGFRAHNLFGDNGFNGKLWFPREMKLGLEFNLDYFNDIVGYNYMMFFLDMRNAHLQMITASNVHSFNAHSSGKSYDVAAFFLDVNIDDDGTSHIVHSKNVCGFARDGVYYAIKRDGLENAADFLAYLEDHQVQIIDGKHNVYRIK